MEVVIKQVHPAGHLEQTGVDPPYPYSQLPSCQRQRYVGQRWKSNADCLQDVYGSIQDVKDLRDKLKLGDVVTVLGVREGGHVLLAARVDIVRLWQDTSAGVSFRPQPSPYQQRRQESAAAVGAATQPESQQPAAPPSAQQRNSWAVERSPTALPAAVAAAVITGPQSSPPPQQQQPQALCKFWVNTGRCAKGAECPYPHVQSGMLQQTWVTQM